MTDDELLEELFNRMMNSDVFCRRLINACMNFSNILDEEE